MRKHTSNTSMKRHSPFLQQIALVALLASLTTLARAQSAEQYVLKDDPTHAYHSLTNRRALVGPHCFLNNTINGVEVGYGYQDPQNITDEDINNFTTIVKTVSLGDVVMTDIVSVRDLSRYYTSGTQVGFSLVSEPTVSVLNLKLVDFFSIFFYKDGELVGSATAESGDAATGLGLSLIKFGGDTKITRDIVATAPADQDGNSILFDEIKLSESGVNLEVGSAIGIKYAFVGRAKEFYMNKDGMEAYARYKDKEPGNYSTRLTNHADWCPDWSGTATGKNHFYNEDLTDGTTIQAVITIGSSATIGFRMWTRKGEEAFPAGTTVGFKYEKDGLLDLSVVELGDVIGIYDQANAFKSTDYETLEEHRSGGKVLGLGVVNANGGTVMVTTEHAFSCADFKRLVVADINMGAVLVNYAFIRLPPDIDHHCALNITASREICDCDNVYELRASKAVNWSLVNADGTETPLTTTATAHYTHTFGSGDLNRTFTFKATDSCTPACSETTQVTYGIQGYDPTSTTNDIVYLTNTYGASRKYEEAVISGEGALLNIADGMHNLSALVTPTLRDYAYRQAGVALAANKAFVGVARIDGQSMSKGSGVPFASKKKRVGFIFSQDVNVLDANLLKFLNIRLYKNVNGTYQKVTQQVEEKGWDVLTLGIGGNPETARKRVYITVDANVDFDAMELCSSGVLDANLSQLNFFTGYIENAEVTATDKKLPKDLLVSDKTTNATIDFAHSNMIAVATVGNGILNMTNLIDADYGDGKSGLNSMTQFPAGVQAGGACLAVNIGRTVRRGQMIILSMKNFQAGLGANVASVMQVQTFRHNADGTIVQDADGNDLALQTKSDWDIIKADVIGSGDYQQVAMTVTADCDQIRITPVQTVSALNAPQIYGIIIRSDANGDGVPDELDPNPCDKEDLVLQEQKGFEYKTREYSNCAFAFRREFVKDRWNPIMLPVNLSKAQFEFMFGDNAKLSDLSDLAKTNGYNVIRFTIVDDETDGVFMEANHPYIIYLDNVSDPNARYQSYDEGTVQGPYYYTPATISNGVSLTPGLDGARKATVKEVPEVSSPDFRNVVFHPTWGTNEDDDTNRTRIPTNAYFFSGGDLYYHNTVGKNLYTYAYRGYITAFDGSTTPQAKSAVRGFTSGNDTPTLIQVVERGESAEEGKFYDLAGRPVDIEKMKRGIFVTKGKKITR